MNAGDVTHHQPDGLPSSDDTSPEESSGRLSLPCLIMTLIAAVLLVFAVLFATRIFGVLYGIVFPANPPLPTGLVRLEHNNLAYGVDEWVYGTEQDGCEILDYYQRNGGTCSIAPGICGPSGFQRSGFSSQNIGACTGTEEFSIFAMRWEMNVTSGYRSPPTTRFSLRREVFWTGSIPRPTPIMD